MFVSLRKVILNRAHEGAGEGEAEAEYRVVVRSILLTLEANLLHERAKCRPL